MKNTIKLFGIIAFIAVIGFSMASCDLEEDEPSYSFEGTWDGGNETIKFNDNNFQYFRYGTGNIRGTFTYTSTHIVFNTTHFYKEGLNMFFYSGDGWVEYFTYTGNDPFQGLFKEFDGRSVPYKFGRTGSSNKEYISIELGIWGDNMFKK